MLLALLGIAPIAQAQPVPTSLSGTVTDAETEVPLPGANVYIEAIAQGTTTDGDGAYHLFGLASGSVIISFSFTGYQNQEITVTLTAGTAHTLDIALTPGVELDPIQVTAGRRQAKALNAPASVDVVGIRDLSEETGPTAVTALRNLAGVDMAQTGYDRQEVVIRGFNNAFTAALYALTDYRQAAVAALGVNSHNIMPSLGIDLERIEVVRGPGSALYGAGVDAGVIHYITKDAFAYPGATVSVAGGDHSFLDFQGRVAGVIGNKLGVKVAGAYMNVDNFQLEGCPASVFAARRFEECPDPHDAQQIAAYGERETATKRLNVYGSLEYRFGSRTSLLFNGGHSLSSGTTITGIGVSQADNWGYTFGQLQFKSGGFFAQAYINQNDAGDTYLYAGDTVVDNGRLVNMQAQYDLSLAGGREQLVFGVDVDLTRPNTEGTIHGRFEERDHINEYGAYVQSLTRIGDRLELIVAARSDYSNVVDNIQFSPRAAFVYKPAPAHSIRATFNRAFSSPLATRVFLDIVAGQIPGTGIRLRGHGASEGFTWERNTDFLAFGAPTDLVASSLVPGSEGAPVPVGLPTGDLYAAIYRGLAAVPPAELARQVTEAGIPITAATAAVLVQLLSPDVTEVTGFSPGVMGLLNPTTAEIETFVTDLLPLPPLSQTVSQTFEIGYKGIVNDRVLVAFDGYFGRKKNFIGPLSLETPFVVVPTLSQDLTNDIALGIVNNTVLAGTLDAAGLAPETVAALLVQLAGQSGALPSASTPVAIVQPVENNLGAGHVPELMLTYRNFGSINYYGIDAAIQLIASEKLEFFANTSWVSDDLFDNEELNEPSKNVSLALNASPLKIKFGGAFRHPGGLTINGSARYSKGFPVRSGVHVGDIDDYFLVDMVVSYRFGSRMEGLRINLGVSNLFNSSHRQFIGAPKIGRVTVARLTYTFNFPS